MSGHYYNDIKHVPTSWIFEYYLNLPVQLTGQNLMIKSVLNPEDTNPSLQIYYSVNKQAYYFKDFSTGISGSATDLIANMFNLSFVNTCNKICTDYSDNKDASRVYTPIDAEHVTHWKVHDAQVREWRQNDAKYWSEYNIGSELLKRYNVQPLSQYTMSKVTKEGAPQDSFIVTGRHIYGYYSGATLYKIYQPKNLKKKFIKLENYTQGYDQLQQYNTLLICSSLKDIMSVQSLGLHVDCIAPHSENTMFKDVEIAELKCNYEYIIVLLDSDTAGVKAMQKYKEKFKLPFIYLSQAKDIADIVKNNNKRTALELLCPRINVASEQYKQLNPDIC